MKRTISIVVLIFCFVPGLQAQDKKPNVVALSEPALGERGTSRVLYWNQEKDVAVAAVTVDFGRPVWNKGYDDPVRFGLATKGKVWRLGSDYWTILDSNVPIKMAGRDIPTGLWYLGLYRSDDGSSWSLAFIDPVKARRSRLDPFAMNTVPVEFKVPMTAEQAAGTTEKLTLSLSAQEENMKNVTLRIMWGRLQLMAPVQVLLEN
ncbi:MAG TPA: DUF2911 domain-containing protein [Terriglobia bacterium]|nr:DUF2911 domain-containing protein [Terriglobia bacterium]